MLKNQTDLFEDKEYAPDMKTIVRQKIEELIDYRRQLDTAEEYLKTLKATVDQIESQDLPAMLDEFQIDELVFQDGLKIALNDKLFTYVNVPERQEAWKRLNEIGLKGVIKPVISIVVSQEEDEQTIKDLITIIHNSIEHEKIELDYKYHAGQLCAVANDVIDVGIELDKDIFKQSVKRGVKITQSKLSKKGK